MVVLRAALLEGVVWDVRAIASVRGVASIGGEARLARVVVIVVVGVQVIAHEGGL